MASTNIMLHTVVLWHNDITLERPSADACSSVIMLQAWDLYLATLLKMLHLNIVVVILLAVRVYTSYFQARIQLTTPHWYLPVALSHILHANGVWSTLSVSTLILS